MTLEGALLTQQKVLVAMSLAMSLIERSPSPPVTNQTLSIDSVRSVKGHGKRLENEEQRGKRTNDRKREKGAKIRLDSFLTLIINRRTRSTPFFCSNGTFRPRSTTASRYSSGLSVHPSSKTHSSILAPLCHGKNTTYYFEGK